MKQLNSSVNFFFQVAKFQTKLSRRFDAVLGGISFNELIILHHLSQSEKLKMRRVDLAEKVGLTASGVTRLLLPMEKIGLVKREIDKNDARVSFVTLAAGGKTKLSEGLERAELFAVDLIDDKQTKNISKLTTLLMELEKKI